MPTDAQPHTTPEHTWPWWVVSGPQYQGWQWVLVCLAALCCTIAMTWPVALSLGDGVMTTPERTVNPDLGQNVWNVWHIAATWRDGDLLWSRLVAAPLAINMATQSYGLTNLVLTLPIALIAGPIVAANSIILLGFWAGIVLMTVLAVRVTRSLPLAFVLACVFVLSPAHLKNIEWAADENAALQWIVLVHLAAVWWLRQPNLQRSSVLALVMLVVSLASGYFGLYGVMYVGLLTVVTLWAVPMRRWRIAVVSHGSAVVVLWAALMAVVSSELTNPLVRAGVHWDAAQVSIGGTDGLRDWVMRQTIWLHVVSVADLITPLRNHPLWGNVPLIAQVQHPSEMGGYLGLVCLGLLVWTSLRHRAVRLLLGVAAVCVVLAGGLELKLWYDQPFAAIPGLFWVLDVVGVFRNASRPGLFLLYAWIPLVLVLAYGVSRITRRWVVVVVCVGMLVDFAPPKWVVVPMLARPIASVVPTDGLDGAVLTLPIQKNDQQPLLDQLCHQRPIASGYLARTPGYPVPWEALTVPRDSTRILLPHDGVTSLHNMGIRYVVGASAGARASLDALAPDGVVQLSVKQDAALYEVPDRAVPVLSAGTGWWDEESDTGRVWRWSTGDASLVFLSAIPRRIQLVIEASSVAGVDSQWELDGRSVGTVAIAAQPGQTLRVLSLAIPAGRSILRMQAPTVTDAYGRSVAVAFTQLYVRSAQPVFGTVIPQLPFPRVRPLCATETP
jgi:hypothetical protein